MWILKRIQNGPTPKHDVFEIMTRFQLMFACNFVYMCKGTERRHIYEKEHFYYYELDKNLQVYFIKRKGNFQFIERGNILDFSQQCRPPRPSVSPSVIYMWLWMMIWCVLVEPCA